MKTSRRGRDLIVAREGKRLLAYRDSVGVWTIGVGHTGRMAPPPVHPGMRIDDAQCDAFLAADLEPVEKALNAALKVRVTQNQFDALASLIFNVGTGYAKPDMTIIRRLNAGDTKGAAAAFDLFRKPAVIIGRRNQEKAQFQQPDAPVAVLPTLKPTPAPAAPSPAPAEDRSLATMTKGNIMQGLFLGLVTQQWQSVLRWVLTSAGVALASRGVLTGDQWAGISPQIESVVGGLVALGSGAWSLASHKPTTIISTADALKARGH